MNDLTSIYNRYYKVMLVFAKRILGDMSLAEDAVQSAFLKIVKHPEHVLSIPIDDLKPYLIVVSENSARSIYKKLNKFEETSLENVDLFENDQEDKVVTKIEALNIFNMPQLSPQYRDVIILKYYYDLDTKSIAQILDISQANVRVRLNRAKNIIQKTLSEGV